MWERVFSTLKVVGVGLVVLGVLGGGVAAVLMRNAQKVAAGEGAAPVAHDARPQLTLLAGQVLEVPADVIRTLGVRTTEVRQAGRPRAVLTLNGTLAYDPDRLVRIKPLFTGEVVALGETTPSAIDGGAEEPGRSRPLRYGDHVSKGQLLAIIWSKDLGEKKSELVNALSQLRLDEEIVDRLREAYEKNVIPQRTLREAEQKVEADRIAVVRAERTLRSWRLTEAEIDVIRQEAVRLRQSGAGSSSEHDETWARVDVKSPQDGTVLEKNVSVGDLVDPSVDMFKIGDLQKLCVWASVYEDDLPALNEMARPIPWKIRLKADPAAELLTGTVETIAQTIDPQQHTALLMGRLDNTQGRLRIGQLVTATIDLPAADGEIEVPATAVVEDGQSSIVFVQTQADPPRFAMRQVSVARRYHDVVCVQRRPVGGAQTLRPGERVVSAGALEFKAAMELQASPSSEK
jgi:cobalt-zinc-cadmium efflux system membrane fusion protein